MTGGLRILLLAAALLGGLLVVRLAAWPVVLVELSPAANASVPVQGANAAPRLVAESLAPIVSRDPFRVTRRPATAAYDPLRLAEQLTPPPPKPLLTVVGLMGGAEPAAVVEGLPGVEGSRVVRVGDVVAGLRIERIGSEQVVIVGMDTTWVLKVREPWR